MRAFIVLCLCATVLAAPQGYNYPQQQQQQQQQQQSFGSSSFNTNSASSGSSLFNHGSFLQEALKNSKFQSSLLGGQSGSAQHTSQVGGQVGTAQQQFSTTPQFNQQQSFGFSNVQQQQHQQQPSFVSNFGGQQQAQSQYQNYQGHQQFQSPSTVTKDIYVHVAPEEREAQQYQQALPPAPPRKHYRIVFIKAPSQNLNKAAVRINQAPTEEKTIIYVLTKKPDPLDLQAALQEAQPKQPSKPEVYFIKYKTQEEAQHAQRTIQAQYDQLGGTTQISDEGIAPVTSVIGSLDGQHGNGGVATQQTSSSSSLSSASSSGGSSSNVSKYLPPIVKL